MAAGSASSPTICFKHNPVLGPKPTSTSPPVLLFSPLTRNFGEINLRCRRKPKLTVCFVLENEKLNTQSEIIEAKEIEVKIEEQSSAARLAEKLARKRSERFTYLVAAVMSSLGITSMAVLAIYYRFSWQMEVPINHSVLLLQLNFLALCWLH